MGVLTTSTESTEDDCHRNLETDGYSSNEETKLLQKEKSPPQRDLKYPKSIIFIIGNEFCERFTYYGLRTVLTLYLIQRLYYDDTTATLIYHAFTMVAYFTPLFGAVLADSFLGKFRTILYLSILYSLGCIILSFGAYPSNISTMTITSLVGLLIIAIGTGGIKPCVSAFGGDQFKEGQEKQLQKFFSLFYIAINLGSVLSTFFTPMLRGEVQCFGDQSCYSLAFGVPAILMIVAVVLFIGGKSLYIIRPPSGNIVLRVTKCICHAIGKKFSSSEKKKDHWLDYADDKFDKKLIEDIKILLHVFVLYIPLPLFWALFDQQGSRWTLQATRMDGKLNGFHLQPDQMQVLNPFLIIAFIPLFDYIVYPLLSKCHLLQKPLQRMTAGGILAAVSFLVAGLLELRLEEYYPVLPSSGNSQLSIMNNSPCKITINGTNMPPINAFGTSVAPEIPLENYNNWEFTPSNCTINKPTKFPFYSNSSIETMMITLVNDSLKIIWNEDSKTKEEDGQPRVRFFYNIDPPANTNVSFLLKSEEGEANYANGSQDEFGVTEYTHFPPGRYTIYLLYNESAYQTTPVLNTIFRAGGRYIVNIYDKSGDQKKAEIFEMAKGNEISMLYQIPQYIIITAGEIMFSITGLEFSYSQSPNSMKSVVQAAWLLVVAIGNLVVMVIAKLQLFEKASYELLLFAVLMAVDMAIFAVLAYFYKYVTITNPNTELEIASREKNNESQGRSNAAYDEDKF